MKKHMLKIYPEFFEAVLSGDKPFEVRDNFRRDFQKGDQVCLIEFDPYLPLVVGPNDGQSGRSIVADISYVTGFEQKEGYVVIGLKNIRAGATT
ncbi:DUF3850 domain-containing protein [Marinobacter sp.]|uniref:DUF3850 domain-containing protein n=1 Tax=Marinobacter sp. TaxID=50741 RepID=UPI0034A2072F